MMKRMTTHARSLVRLTLSVTLMALATSVAHAQESDQPLTQSCISELRSKATSQGVSAATFDQAMQGVVAKPELMDKLNYQPEFKLPIWDYLASLVDGERVLDGTAMLVQYKTELASIAEQYGVDAQTVVAVWGVESNYGQNTGGRDIVESLATLSCMGRRQSFFSGEFVAALKILQAGDFERDLFKGSWAGAFGQTQFMPSTFLRLAVDGDGDGKRNLITNPVDALASTANFLKRAGWRAGQTWGFEVKLNKGTPSVTGRKSMRGMSYWVSQGLSRVDGSNLVGGDIGNGTDAALLLPAGDNGPAFLLLHNFKAIYSYNASESYGLAIAHLSDRLRGQGVFATPWPTDDAGLGRAEKREVQTLLIARGHDIGEVDGALGSKSQAAIKLEQQRLGHEATGRAGQKLLAALRASQ